MATADRHAPVNIGGTDGGDRLGYPHLKLGDLELLGEPPEVDGVDRFTHWHGHDASSLVRGRLYRLPVTRPVLYRRDGANQITAQR